MAAVQAVMAALSRPNKVDTLLLTHNSVQKDVYKARWPSEVC